MYSHNNMNKSFFSLFYKLAALVRHRISLFGKTSQSIQILKKQKTKIILPGVPHFTDFVLSGSDSSTMVSCLHILSRSLDFR